MGSASRGQSAELVVPIGLEHVGDKTVVGIAASKPSSIRGRLDPVARQVALVDALEESVVRRVVSVDNGEPYLAAHRRAPLDTPEGYEIFETVGAWEDYSTPSRDMRLLISLDAVLGFPDQVREAPERFGLKADERLAESVALLQSRLDDELRSRSFQYTRSDGTPWILTPWDIAQRQRAFEMAYNPNDCIEIR